MDLELRCRRAASRVRSVGHDIRLKIQRTDWLRDIETCMTSATNLRTVSAMKITFMQTSDPTRYAPLLEIGAHTVRAYVSKFDHSYTSFMGVQRGSHPWQATYNRISMLMEMLETGHGGWVCYMDADAFIADQEFDLCKYLSDKTSIAFIAAHSGIQPSKWFDANIGVFLINLDHSEAQRLIREWHRSFMDITDSQLNSATNWDDVPNDQLLFHRALQRISGIERDVIIGTCSPSLINYQDGKFIRQVLRTPGNTVEQRAAVMRTAISKIYGAKFFLSDASPGYTEVSTLEEDFIASLYRTLLMREPDADGFKSVISNFRSNRKTLEQELRDCIGSTEFSLRSEQFIRKFVPKSSLLTRFVNDVSQNGEVELLIKLMTNSNSSHKTIVDVGARGRERSNSYDLLRHFGWRGVLIEANPELIDPISRDFDGLDFVLLNYAVSDHSGKAAFFLGTNNDVSSLSKHAARGWGEIVGEVEVNVERLSVILKANKVPADFDVLSIDVEGEDVKVLNDLIQKSEFRPEWIIIEVSHDNNGSISGLGFCESVTENYHVAGYTKPNLILGRRSALVKSPLVS